MEKIVFLNKVAMTGFKKERGYTELNFISVTIYILALAGFYLSWKYAPIYWDRETIKDITENAMLAAHKAGPDAIRQIIMDRAQKETGNSIDYKNLNVYRDGAEFKVDLSYVVIVDHPFYGVTKHRIEIKTQRTLIY